MPALFLFILTVQWRILGALKTGDWGTVQRMAGECEKQVEAERAKLGAKPSRRARGASAP